MASQYKLIARKAAAAATTEITGNGRIRMAVLYTTGANAVAAIRDDITGLTTPIAELSALSGTTLPLHFDNAEGGLPFSTGLNLTVTGANAVLYVYGS